MKNTVDRVDLNEKKKANTCKKVHLVYKDCKVAVCGSCHKRF